MKTEKNIFEKALEIVNSIPLESKNRMFAHFKIYNQEKDCLVSFKRTVCRFAKRTSRLYYNEKKWEKNYNMSVQIEACLILSDQYYERKWSL